jgi:hypothetical protein
MLAQVLIAEALKLPDGRDRIVRHGHGACGLTALAAPVAIDDPLTEVAREGARRILALIAEASFVAQWKDLKLLRPRVRGGGQLDDLNPHE